MRIKLFDVPVLNGRFAILPDAQRFCASVPPESPREQSVEADPLSVVLNWRGQAKK
jgi:hypothetical protein